MKTSATLLLAGLTALLATAFRPPAAPLTQIFLVGDSTMADKSDLSKPERGWGMEFGQYFDSGVVIRNTAVNGRSTKSFYREGRWTKVLAALKPGDWVFIQFGHNDSKAEDSTRSAPAQTLYRQLLTRFVLEARQKGANPVLLTPVGRRYFDDNGKRKDDHGEYPGVVREVAKAQKVPLIDLHEQSWAMYSALGEAGTPRKSLNATAFDDIRDFLRPNMLSLTRCKQVLLEDFVIQNSPAWTIHPLLCENLTVRRVTVRNPWYGQNTDAIDVESCRDGLIEGCTFDVGDDGLCIKSGRDAEGRRRGVPTENFIIRDCRVYHAHGGFVIGSEMSGGVRNLYVSNCTFMGTDVGLRFKTARGRGGVVENIFVDGIDMTDIAGEAVLFDMYYAAKDPVPMAGESTAPPVIAAQPLNEGTPQFKGFQISNITCKGAATGILVRGLPEMSIRDISIENAVIESKKGLICQEAESIRLKNVTLLSTDTTPVLEVQNSRNIALDGIRYADGADLLLRVTGERSKDIRLTNTDTKKARRGVELGPKMAKKTVTVAAR